MLNDSYRTSGPTLDPSSPVAPASTVVNGGHATAPAAASAAAFAANSVVSTVTVQAASGDATFNLELDGKAATAPSSYTSGWTTAATLLSEAIQDPITINLEIGYTEYPQDNSPVGPNEALGGEAYGATDSYSQIRDFLSATGASDVTSAVNALPDTSSLNGMSSFYVASAEEKAFGQIASDATAIDGYAGFGTGWDGLIVGAALHEFTHAMGRDVGDSVLSLFRYTSSGAHSFSDSTPAPATYFSVDGGNSVLADFGQSSDPSDFLNNSLTVNDPFDEIAGGNSLTALDRTMLDMLGFGASTSTTLTEPKSTLPVLVGGTTTISHNFLWSYDTNNLTGAYGDPADITYTVTSPAHGTLLLNGRPSNNFTQADIDNGLVQYHDNGDAAGSDGFTFTVSDKDGNRITEPYDIAVVDTTTPVKIGSGSLSAPPAGPAVIWTDSLCTVAVGNEPGDVNYTLRSAPAHGTLFLDGAPTSTFTQAEIDDRRVEYRENGNVANSDAFVYTVSDKAGDETAPAVFTIALSGGSLAITQINAAGDTAATVTPDDYITVAAGSGDTTLTAAGAAPNLFDFSSLAFGNDTIVGFDAKRDALRFNSSLAGDFATVVADMSATAAGGTLIDLDKTHSITLADVSPSSLGAANFRFT